MNELPPRVCVVDDDACVRKHLAHLLRSAGYRAETFATAGDFLDHRRVDESPDCLVLAVDLPDLGGLELQRELLDSPNPIPIVFITCHGDIPTSVKAMKAGAVDFLLKPFHDEELLEAVREASACGKRNHAEFNERGAIQQHFARLTARERDVMSLVVRGLPNKQIGSELGIGEKTVKVHRGRVMSKMQVRSLAELVRAALKLGDAPLREVSLTYAGIGPKSNGSADASPVA
jgi:FixJ family two-component response regulator